jgi:hypothetical protein
VAAENDCRKAADFHIAPIHIAMETRNALMHTSDTTS